MSDATEPKGAQPEGASEAVAYIPRDALESLEANGWADTTIYSAFHKGGRDVAVYLASGGREGVLNGPATPATVTAASSPGDQAPSSDSEVEGIVRRLRRWSAVEGWNSDSLHHEAAALIARLTRARDKALETNETFATVVNRMSATHAAEIAALRERCEGLTSALRELVESIDVCEPAIISAFAFQYNHGIHYGGPTYAEALVAARAALEADRGAATPGESDDGRT